MTVRIHPSRLVLERAGKFRNVYHARVEAGHTPAEVMDPDYFGQVMKQAHNASQAVLTPGDLIEVEAEDFSWDCTLRVHAQSPSTQQLITRLRGEINYYDTADFPKGWTAEWLGGAEHYAIYFDGVLKDQGITSKDGCLARINGMIAQDMQAAGARAANSRASAANKGAQAKKAEAA